ncbi:MAG: hypothetical protein CVU45_05865 [Chloroflexi bacterium HGW-Chloroflexi-7]|nr:MAG: hypothetical protein CVU45_05865 [Chloroflexi bacterium HGW-Chloroflexi-7]
MLIITIDSDFFAKQRFKNGGFIHLEHAVTIRIDRKNIGGSMHNLECPFQNESLQKEEGM